MTEQDPSWQPDPTGRFEHRYWDGSRWTDNVSNAGVASTDPYTEADAASDVTQADAPIPGEPAAPADPTAQWPTPPTPPADGAPAAPPTPPPYVPGAAAAQAASAGSKKGLLIAGGVVAAAAVAAAAVLLTGDDGGGDRGRIRAEMAEEIRQDGELTEEQALCVADHVIDKIGVDRLKDVDFSADEPPADIEDDLFDAAFGSLDACDIDLSALGGSDDFDDDTLDDIAGSLPDDFGEQLAEIYRTTLGLTSDQAECLADKVAEAIDSGALSEDEAMSEIFSYLSDCDISMSDLEG